MPRKSSTPTKRTARLSRAVTQERARRGRNVAFIARLEQLIEERCGGSRTAFAELVGVGTTHVTRWCVDGVMPGGSKLLEIAEATGVSVDWLLGFDVPRFRGEA